MGSASPVMPSGEPCWDTALGSDTSTKASPQATVGPVCSALLCMESALGGMKAMSSVLNNKLPGCRDPRQGSVWPPIKTLEPGIWGWQIVRPTYTPSATQPYQPCVWVGPSFCPLLCSGGSDSCYRERLFTQRISPHTHNDPIGPACLANQLLRSATNRQGGEKELTVSLARHLHFTLHMHPQTALLHPKITELTQIQWCRLYFFSPPFYTYKASGQKIGQTLHGCGSTENGCFPHWNGGMQ